jgi:hypothetical protein
MAQIDARPNDTLLKLVNKAVDVGALTEAILASKTTYALLRAAMVAVSMTQTNGQARDQIVRALDKMKSKGFLTDAMVNTAGALAPVAQVETATVVGTIGVAGAGNATVIVTAAGMTGSPKTVSVAVANNDTAAQVAGKIRTALAADANVGHATTGFFTVSGANENVVLTARTAAANDGTLNISIDNGTCTGLTAAPTSANTTAGVAPNLCIPSLRSQIQTNFTAAVGSLHPTLPASRRGHTTMP